MERLSGLLEEVRELATGGEDDWLLRASECAEAIGRAFMDDSDQLDALRKAVIAEADASGCDLIVGASDVAHALVRGLMPDRGSPSRVLIFDLVRITGAAITQAAAELRDVDIVPAVLVDVGPASKPAFRPRSVAIEYLSRP